MYLVTAQEMRDLDRYTIEHIGIPGVVLMERAGLAVAQAITEHFAQPGQAVVLSGHGNNGGDGFVVARHLSVAGWRTTVWLVGSAERMTADTQTFYEACRHLGIDVKTFGPEQADELRRWLETSDVVVDALLGTGIRGPVRPAMESVIRLVNDHARGRVVAVDVPSGVETDTGRVASVAIKADQTVTFAYAKWCHYLRPGAEHCGEVVVADIGIPPSVTASRRPAARVNHPQWWREYLKPRSRWAHKGTHGHLLVVGGSRGMLGAVAMAGTAALRAGAGLVTIAVPEGQHDPLAAKVTEALVWAWPDDGQGRFAPGSAERIGERLNRLTAVAVGPGLGRFTGEREWLTELLQQTDRPMVLDADALNVLADHPDILDHRKGDLILTPHPGEMARLAGTDTVRVENERYRVAKEWAERHDVTVVLKGTYTIIAFPDGTQMLNPTGSPAMAKAGSGDLLTGIIGALLAQKIPPSAAVPMGVYVHGLAGEFAVTSVEHSVIASDILLQVGPAIRRLLSDRVRT
ncbi:NAD(P)H-hydrate dehydratase [Polycladomyces subterraneus]|uniref:Bifunctional NAD(P)H-hydrate repair enzyme n=1 Tax=Polycladomyces subterraneus TaxID=1016997 RepID=A0ABT8ILJ5_9BACL|nr:NAD(P)H-hydrate dehydratase [Polycladomyces subterraneus]MDN4593661.1 NAD(P)H-hydrate dehydratase [Polycladomyces subterraneus]